MITLYIHGFASCGLGGKARAFREYYKSKNKKLFAPSLAYNPNLAIDTLEQFIELHERKVNLIGSSLGGYYATYLATKYDLKAVLINPAVKSTKVLENSVGMQTHYCDLSKFEWNEIHINELKKFNIVNPKVENFMLLLQSGDEVLNYKDALEKFQGAKIVLEEGGNHSFEGIERYFEEIEEFFKS
jgi:predicted esterase YcpF (UPF0227 family)